jgi:hypothetical protein
LQKAPDPNGASTSKAEDPEEGNDGSSADDLQLAFEVADMARLVFERNADCEEVTAEVLGETFELLGDIGAEEERFPESIEDYEKVRATVRPASAHAPVSGNERMCAEHS